MPMIRLIIRSQTPEEVVLEVHGWVSGGNVSILEQEGVRVLGESGRLVLDLRGVQFIDEEGVGVLRGWVSEGVVLRGGSLFVRMLLEAHGLASEEADGSAYE
jgi:anti-anti-sigma regulatory factor